MSSSSSNPAQQDAASKASTQDLLRFQPKPIPSIALRIDSVDWSGAASSPSLGLDTPTACVLADVVAYDTSCQLEVLATTGAVRYLRDPVELERLAGLGAKFSSQDAKQEVDGVALVIHGAHPKTCFAVAQRLKEMFRVMHPSSSYRIFVKREPPSAHSQAGEGALSGHEDKEGPASRSVVLLLAPWRYRNGIVRSVARLLEKDPTLRYALSHTRDIERREKYDLSIIRSFAQASGLYRQFAGPRRQKWRFSEFALTEERSFSGVRLALEFDDFDVLEHAESTVMTYANSIGGTDHVVTREVFDSSNMEMQTCMLQPTLNMSMRWNTQAARVEMSRMLCRICGISTTPVASGQRNKQPADSFAGRFKTRRLAPGGKT